MASAVSVRQDSTEVREPDPAGHTAACEPQFLQQLSWPAAYLITKVSNTASADGCTPSSTVTSCGLPGIAQR
jgi:hypothetical protein